MDDCQKEYEALMVLEQADKASGAVGFFVDVTPVAPLGKKKVFKAQTVEAAFAKAGALFEEANAELQLTLWHVEVGLMKEVAMFTRAAAQKDWVHIYKEEKQERPLIYTCKLRRH